YHVFFGIGKRIDADIKYIGLRIERSDAVTDVLGCANFQCPCFKSERASCCPDLITLVCSGRIFGIEHDHQATRTRNKLAQKLEAFSSEISRLNGQASHVATRAGQACNKSGANRVRRYCKDDRDRGRRLLGSGNRATCRQDDIHLQANKLGRQVGEAPAVPLGPTIFEGERASITPAEFIQTLGKHGKVRLPRGRRRHAQYADRRPILRARRERPRRCHAAEQRDEIAAVHSITSSARASSLSGTERPNALAVATLMTNSNFSICSTGKSAGVVPLRIRAM